MGGRRAEGAATRKEDGKEEGGGGQRRGERGERREASRWRRAEGRERREEGGDDAGPDRWPPGSPTVPGSRGPQRGRQTTTSCPLSPPPALKGSGRSRKGSPGKAAKHSVNRLMWTAPTTLQKERFRRRKRQRRRRRLQLWHGGWHVWGVIGANGCCCISQAAKQQSRKCSGGAAGAGGWQAAGRRY